MACNCFCPFVHRTSAISAAGLLTVTNATNVGNFDPFCLIVTIDPDAVITGAPVATTVTINGAAVPIIDKWGYPITTDILGVCRTKYKGRYIDSDTPHVTLTDVCGKRTATVTTANESAGE